MDFAVATNCGQNIFPRLFIFPQCENAKRRIEQPESEFTLEEFA
jgi:hypothetical protein